MLSKFHAMNNVNDQAELPQSESMVESPELVQRGYSKALRLRQH